MENSILICGATSFVATGLIDILHANGYHQIDCFSRKNNDSDKHVICGGYENIAENTKLKSSYDIVINFAVLKDQNVEKNIEYVKSLVKLCKEKNVKKLIHFSTVMNYSYDEKIITETTKIESLKKTFKKGYAEIKIATDEYLLSVKESLPFELVLIRPGFVLAEGVACPFIINLPLGWKIIKGNKKSKQPVVMRENIHQAIIRIIRKEHNNDVYHFFPNDGMTKYRYAQKTVAGRLLIMPKWIFKGIPYLLCKIGLMSKSLYSRFEGMYIESAFSSFSTETTLDYKFDRI